VDFPIGAILTNEKVNEAMDFGDHGTTFGGNPLACAAALATLKVMTIPGFLDDVLQKGGWLKHAIESLDLPGMVEIRGLGLMIGVVFEDEAKPIVAAMLEAGVLANATSGNVLRLVPPLTITKPQLQELVAAIEKTTTVPA
jgi:acetylornithine/N-succinyldiaminopimelate aminotransferase